MVHQVLFFQQRRCRARENTRCIILCWQLRVLLARVGVPAAGCISSPSHSTDPHTRSRMPHVLQCVHNFRRSGSCLQNSLRTPARSGYVQWTGNVCSYRVCCLAHAHAPHQILRNRLHGTLAVVCFPPLATLGHNPSARNARAVPAPGSCRASPAFWFC